MSASQNQNEWEEQDTGDVRNVSSPSSNRNYVDLDNDRWPRGGGGSSRGTGFRHHNRSRGQHHRDRHMNHNHSHHTNSNRRRGGGGGGGSNRFRTHSRQYSSGRYSNSNSNSVQGYGGHHHSNSNRDRDSNSNHNRRNRAYNTHHHHTHRDKHSNHNSRLYRASLGPQHQHSHSLMTSTITDIDIESKCAYATMVINNPEYLAGALTLAWSLLKSGSKAQRAVIIDAEINEKYGTLIKLTGLFHTVFIIPQKLSYHAIQKPWRKYAESCIYDWINTAFNKYYCFQLTQYSRVIMLDADQICLKNPDELFKLGCPAGICSFYSELNNTLQCRRHGSKVPNADIRRSYERQWGIRGCLFMIEPSTNTFNDILQQLEYQQLNYGGIGNSKCFLGADEKFLTKYYMTTAGDLQDSEWTHIHTKFSRLSYIDKTTLAEDPYFLHFCTFKPWKRPNNDKWKYEQWEDIAIWTFAATSASLHASKCIPIELQGEYVPKMASIFSPDAQFFCDVLAQPWCKQYIEFAENNGQHIPESEVLMSLYNIMKNSYKKQQLEKQNQTKDLKKKIAATMDMNGYDQFKHHLMSMSSNNHRNGHSGSPKNESNDAIEDIVKQSVKANQSKMHHGNKAHLVNRFWSFDYHKKLLLSALLSEAEEKVPDKVIWQFWNAPYEEMPQHIKFCIESVRRNNPDWKHILITPANIWRYLDEDDVPKNLLQFDKACHISDVVRVAVLAKYGGIYCDATIICFKGCRYMNFNYFWDKLMMEQGRDFVGFRYDNQKTKWKNDEKFCCWFMATKKDNGLFYSWLKKIKLLMKGNKTSNSQLKIFDLLYGGDYYNDQDDDKEQQGTQSTVQHRVNVQFKKYVALGPGILDELFDEYCHYHPNFKYQLYDPRDFALLDQFFNYEQLWYLNKNDEYDFKEWFETKSPHFIKLFCAERGTKQLHALLRQQHRYHDDKQITAQNVLDAGLILSDIFQFV